ncbi:hypothetical protein DMW20_11825 [Vibrio parahaemolyticus]|nr:hypothetical protein [Vibrio parahaemolyticus]
MKQELKRTNPEYQKRVLEAVFRLKRNSRDFEAFLEFARFCLETKKKDLIIAQESDFRQLQGEASVLSGLFDLLELAETEGNK